MSSPARFHIRTYGCQMNVHDSEKLANLLHHAGLRSARSEDDAELLLINTCSIREKAEHRLYSDLGALRAWKAARAGRVLGVGGCVAQQEGDVLLRRFPQLDFAFGTHNLRLVPTMVRAALTGARQARTEETRSLLRFELPERHPAFESATPGRAFLTVMEGCDMFCSFCIVPRTRGREISRPAASIISEARALAARGVRELTLLGQTVNAYGRHERRRAARRQNVDARGVLPFAALLRELAALPGIERLRYTSPHPLFFDDALCRAHAEVPQLCPHVHLPLQSGADRVLARMRRRYSAREYLEIVRKLYAARADLALTTDLIVGFPGETRADFEATLAVMREARFADAYAFKYSPRPGTAALALEDAVEPAEAQARLEELQEVQRELTLAAHRARVGEVTPVLVEGPSAHARQSRADAKPARVQLRGRDLYHRVVNFEVAPASAPKPGEVRDLRIVCATPHSLIGELVTADAADATPHSPIGTPISVGNTETAPHASLDTPVSIGGVGAAPLVASATARGADAAPHLPVVARAASTGGAGGARPATLAAHHASPDAGAGPRWSPVR